nr:hypothetical protein Iba_chr05fCG4270 [Ipomoea batatas]
MKRAINLVYKWPTISSTDVNLQEAQAGQDNRCCYAQERPHKLDTFLLQWDANKFSIAFTSGFTINAYLAIGLMSVVRMATLELSLWVGRFRVTWDRTFGPNMRYPRMAIDA